MPSVHDVLDARQVARLVATLPAECVSELARGPHPDPESCAACRALAPHVSASGYSPANHLADWHMKMVELPGRGRVLDALRPGVIYGAAAALDPASRASRNTEGS